MLRLKILNHLNNPVTVDLFFAIFILAKDMLKYMYSCRLDTYEVLLSLYQRQF